jgi:hypothetical protein
VLRHAPPALRLYAGEIPDMVLIWTAITTAWVASDSLVRHLEP